MSLLIEFCQARRTLPSSTFQRKANIDDAFNNPIRKRPPCPQFKKLQVKVIRFASPVRKICPKKTFFFFIRKTYSSRKLFYLDVLKTLIKTYVNGSYVEFRPICFLTRRWEADLQCHFDPFFKLCLLESLSYSPDC